MCYSVINKWKGAIVYMLRFCETEDGRILEVSGSRPISELADNGKWVSPALSPVFGSDIWDARELSDEEVSNLPKFNLASDNKGEFSNAKKRENV